MAGFGSNWTAAARCVARETIARVLVGSLAVAAPVVASGPASAVARPVERACDAPDRKIGHCRPRLKKAANGHPQIESGGTMPALANTVPLLRPGTFRLDMSGFYASYPLFGTGTSRTAANAALLETLTLAYGYSDRLTLFGGATESNIIHSDGVFRGEFVDPRVGFVYRLANAPKLWGNALDFIGDVTANAPLSSPQASSGPYGNLGPIARGRLLLTRELGHGFTLQANGGFQAALVTTWPYGGLPSHTGEVDAILGIAGQYRLAAISDRLYVNTELDLLKPLTNDNIQIYASPFRTADTYSATLGASFVVKPGFLVARVNDTVALNVVNGNNLFPPMGPRHFVSNTVGLTLSFVNLTPQNWLRGLAK